MGRIADVLAELSSLGAVGAPAKLKQEAPKPPQARVPAPAREEPIEDAPEADPDIEATIAALSEGFRPEADPEEDSEEEASDSEDDAEDEDSPEAAEAVADAPSIEERLGIALQEVEAIAEVVEGLRQSLLAIKAELE